MMKCSFLRPSTLLLSATAAAAQPPPPPKPKQQQPPTPPKSGETITFADAVLTGGGMTVLEMGTKESFKEDQRYVVKEMRRNAVNNWVKVLSGLGCIVLSFVFIPPYTRKYMSFKNERFKNEHPEFGPVQVMPEDWRQLMEQAKGDERKASAAFWVLYQKHQKATAKSTVAAGPKSMFGPAQDTAFNTGGQRPKGKEAAAT